MEEDVLVMKKQLGFGNVSRSRGSLHARRPWRFKSICSIVRKIVFALLISIIQICSSTTGCPTDRENRGHGDYTLLEDSEKQTLGLLAKPLPCFGCGIGWFSFLLGFVLPLMWYYATILYFGNYYRRDPRERTGLAACAIAALVFTVVALITVAVIFL